MHVLTINASPLLPHAVVTVRTKKQKFHLVVDSSSNKIIPSTDINQAVKEGCQFGGWTKAGYAIWSETPQTQETTVSADSIDLQRSLVEQKVYRASAASGDTREFMDRVMLNVNFFAAATPSTVAAGTPVLELIPSNAVLRRTIHKGNFEEPTVDKAKVSLIPRPEQLIYENTPGKIRSLWVSFDSKLKLPPIFVSPNAQNGWISPKRESVVCLTDGVLFIRTVAKKPTQ